MTRYVYVRLLLHLRKSEETIVKYLDKMYLFLNRMNILIYQENLQKIANEC